MIKEKGGRQSNLELLRIFSMICVIILHLNISGVFSYLYDCGNTIGYISHSILESVSISAVNIFVMISGFFMSQKKEINYLKPVLLFLEVITLGLCFEVGSIIIHGGSFSIAALIPNDYFVFFYCTLFLLSPYINKALDNKNARKMAFLCFCLFSVYATAADVFQAFCDNIGKHMQDLSTVTRFGSMSGYTIVNFVMMYIIGAYVRENEEKLKKINVFILFLTCFACVTITTISMVFRTIDRGFSLGLELSYSNPIIIIQSVCIFLIFYKIKIGSIKLINSLSSATFTVYLLHRRFLNLATKGEIYQRNWIIALIYTVCVACFLYFICWLFHQLVYKHIDYLYSKILEKLINLLCPKRKS